MIVPCCLYFIEMTRGFFYRISIFHLFFRTFSSAVWFTPSGNYIPHHEICERELMNNRNEDVKPMSINP